VPGKRLLGGGDVHTCVLACFTTAMLTLGALIAADFSALVATPPLTAVDDQEPAAAGDAYVVQAYYEAANAVLSGAPAGVLAAFVSPAVETYPAGSEPIQGQQGMTSHLHDLQRRGAVRLDVVRTMGTGDDLAALVEVRDASATAAAADRATSSSRMIELFHLEAGRIIGYWPGSLQDGPPAGLPAASIAAAPGELGVSLARIELGPRTPPATLLAPFPHLLLVETGTVAVGRDDSLSLARAGASRFTALPPAMGGGLLLEPGDALLAPAGAREELRNAGETPAAVFSFLLAPRSDLFHPPPVSRRDGATLLGMHDPSRVGTRVTWGNQVRSEVLAFGLLPAAGSPAPPVTLNGSPLFLEPGQRLPALPNGALRFVIVRAGVLAVLERTRQVSATGRPVAGVEAPMQASPLFRAGEAIAFAADKELLLENAGLERLDLLSIEIH
jgi:hypothetical protein